MPGFAPGAQGPAPAASTLVVGAGKVRSCRRATTTAIGRIGGPARPGTRGFPRLGAADRQVAESAPALRAKEPDPAGTDPRMEFKAGPVGGAICATPSQSIAAGHDDCGEHGADGTGVQTPHGHAPNHGA